MLKKISKNKFKRLTFISIFLLFGFLVEKIGLTDFLQKIFSKSVCSVAQADTPHTGDCSDGGCGSTDGSCSDCSTVDGNCCDGDQACIGADGNCCDSSCAIGGESACSECSDGGCSAGDCDCSGGVGCFTYDQKVLTPVGTAEIGKLKVGDKVVSYDEKMNKFTTSVIERIIIHDGVESPWHDFEGNHLIDLVVEINNEMIVTRVTENHLYYDQTNNIYKAIAEFSVGDKLKTYTGEGVIQEKRIVVDKNNPEADKNVVVYNLHMENDPHNYLVNGMVVHNIK